MNDLYHVSIKKNRVLHHIIEGVAIDNIIVALNGDKKEKPMPLGDNYCNERLQFKEVTWENNGHMCYISCLFEYIFYTGHIHS